MKFKFNLCLILMFALVVSGCVSDPIKSPCNSKAVPCGMKIKINQW